MRNPVQAFPSDKIGGVGSHSCIIPFPFTDSGGESSLLFREEPPFQAALKGLDRDLEVASFSPSPS
jgi:hypothetical protein